MVFVKETTLGAGVIAATYVAIAAFYVRLAVHALRWYEATRRSPPARPRGVAASARALTATAVDIVFLRRLLLVNPALWLGEWAFHASLFMIILRHLRYFMHPVPDWVTWAQTPGWIAGFLLPLALGYIFVIRLLTGQEKFSSRANLLMLMNLLAIAITGILMSTRYRVDLAAIKLFALGVVTFNPAAPPTGVLFLCHLCLVVVLLLYIPSHIFTAPLVMMDARGRQIELHRVIHDA